MLDVETIKKLSEVGYMACFKGFIGEGEEIMEGISAAQPGETPINIGLAIAKISAAKYDEAIDILENQVLAVEPNHMTAKCFLGMALKEKGDKQKAQAILMDVNENGEEHEQSIAAIYLHD